MSILRRLFLRVLRRLAPDVFDEAIRRAADENGISPAEAQQLLDRPR